MKNYCWVVECHISKEHWSMVGSVCHGRAEARLEEKWYKDKFKDGHYRIRRYIRDGGSRG